MAHREGWASETHGKNGQNTYCSFCGQSVHWQKYADHLDRVHPGGAVKPLTLPPKKSLMEIAEIGVLEIVR